MEILSYRPTSGAAPMPDSLPRSYRHNLIQISPALGLIFLASCAPEQGEDTAEDTSIASVQSPAEASPSHKLRVAPPSGDTTAPFDPSITIAGGSVWSRSSSVTLTLSAADDIGVTEVCVSNSASCTSWVSYGTSRTWSLGATPGLHTVNAWFRDAAGNVSAMASDTISLDSVAPTNGTVTATGSTGQVALSWSGYSDATSGIDSYKVVQSSATTLASACSNGTVVYTGSATNTTITGLTDGVTYQYRVCALDTAGNVSTGSTASARPAPEYNAPTGGTVLVNNGDTYSRSSVVNLTLSATDDTAVSSMCISNTATCSSWLNYATTRSWSIGGNGTRTVYVTYRDSYGNISSVVTDSIVVDNAKPVNGLVTATPSTGTIDLSWTSFTDAGSGIASYKVVRATSSTAPASCAVGTTVYNGSATQFTDSGLTDGSTYSYRVCATDNAGNISTGRTISSRPAPEFNAPSGSVIINGGDTYTRTGSVTLTLSATDDSSVTGMCISNSARCTAWLPYSSTARWVLSGNSGVRPVYVSFRDVYNNVSANVTDSITIDGRAPTNGVVTASAASGTAINLSWSGYADATSGIGSYKAVYAAGATAPVSCNVGTLGYSGTGTTGQITGLNANTRYSIRVCALDTVGNISTGSVASATTRSEGTPPEGSILINDGDSASISNNVFLTLAATDSSGVSNMCLSESSSCSTWEAYATERSWAFSAVQGTRTVNVWFRDGLGNENSTPESATIDLDWSAPIDGTITPTQVDDTTANVVWTDFSDTYTEIDTYQLVYTQGTVPPVDCEDGTLAYTGSNTSYQVSGLSNRQSWSFRVCATDILGNTSTGSTGTLYLQDMTAPTPESILINGDADGTNDTNVTITLSATDSDSVSEVCLSNTNICSNWQTYTTSLNWSLDTGDGSHTVYAWFKDPTGNISSVISDDIFLDQTAPIDGSAILAPLNEGMSIHLSDFTDQGININNYIVVYDEGATAPADCQSGNLGYEGPDTDFRITGLVNNTQYAFRICADDNAGNLSEGITALAVPAPELDAPVGQISIEAGTAFTNAPLLHVNVSATDASLVTSMCLSTHPNHCSNWVAYSTSTTITVPDIEGTATVYAWFEDEFHNLTTDPVSDTIVIDETLPVDGGVVITPADASVLVDISDFSDDVAGVANYWVVYAEGSTPPASCEEGTIGYYGSSTNITVDGLLNGRNYAFRVCAEDAAGNISNGSTGSALPAPEFDAPVGNIAIEGGAGFTNSSVFTLNISASDASGTALMCLSTDASSCIDWLPYDSSAVVSVDDVEGTATIYAWFEDSFYNRSTVAVSDSIVIDETLPTDGSVSSSGENASVSLLLSNFHDSVAGITNYWVAYDEGTTAPATCEAGTLGYVGSSSSITVDGLTNGTTYSFRVCAEDAAGNLSSGTTVTEMPTPEYDAPVGTIAIEGGWGYTNSPVLSVNVTALDASAVALMCLSTSASSCTNWVPFSSVGSITVPDVEGSVSVYAWFEDEFYNRSTVAVSDSVIIDETRPSDGVAVFTPDDTSFQVDFSGAYDDASGIANYWVVYVEGNIAPLTCNDGILGYSGNSTHVVVDGLTNGINYAVRACVEDAAGNISSGVAHTTLPAPEFNPPVGSISIENGASYTGSSTVNVNISASDASGLSLMCLSTSAVSCNNWVPYSTTASINLAAVDGTSTVYAWFEDTYYNRTTSYVSDTIYQDRTAPVDTAARATALVTGDRSATISWTGFTDARSGLSTYKVVYARSATAPTSCSTGTVGYQGGGSSGAITGLVGGSTYAFRVCAIDAVGNMSNGVTVTAVTPDTTGPTGTMLINAGAIATKTTATTLTFAPVDDSTVTQMCVSNTTACTTFVSYVASRAWTLTTGAGTKTVYVYYKDSVGNRSAAISDTIIYDATVPTNGTVTVNTAVSRQIGLSWTGFADAGSGIASYKVVYQVGTTAPASCNAGTVLYAGTATSVTHTGTVTGTKYSYRVCAIDNATNMSVGATKLSNVSR